MSQEQQSSKTPPRKGSGFHAQPTVRAIGRNVSVRTACSAHTMKSSQGGREETTLHLCRRHKGLYILGGWWPWPSAICYFVSVLEDGGSLPGT